MSLPPRPITIARSDPLGSAMEQHPTLTTALVSGGIGALWGGLIGAVFGAKMIGAAVGATLMGARGFRRGKEFERWMPR